MGTTLLLHVVRLVAKFLYREILGILSLKFSFVGSQIYRTTYGLYIGDAASKTLKTYGPRDKHAL